jgi:hypothetical protein
MKTVDLESLSPGDIPAILQAVHRYLMQNGLALITENVFLKPEALARRWELTISCLNNWRFTGGGPHYIKTGPGPKAQVRYPLMGNHGVMEFEEKHCFHSTSEESQRHTIDNPIRSIG